MKFSDGGEVPGLAPAWDSEFRKGCFSPLSILFYCFPEEAIHQLLAHKLPSNS